MDRQIETTSGGDCGIDDRAYRFGIADVAGSGSDASAITRKSCGNEIESRTIDVG
jgi:hypothetical protein